MTEPPISSGPRTTAQPGAALWQPQAHMPSVVKDRVVIVRGEGSRVQSEQGQWLLDATAGLWHANIGHGRARLAEAAARQMRELETYHTFDRLVNRQALDLADRLVAMSPIADAKAFWVSGGSDAIDTAAKLARRLWQVLGRAEKRIVISRSGSYHGLHAFGTAIAGLDFNREGYGSESLVPETARVPANDAQALEDAILRLGPDRVAAMFAEPVIGTGGVIPPEPGYLESVEAICREHDVLFVVDEVITGFGRTGRMFATERYGLSPDMIVMAKGITSGYLPLGGLLVGPRVWEPFFSSPEAPIFRHGVTYSGHATACAVAQENLDVIEEEGLVQRVAELEPVLGRAVEPLRDHPLVTDVRGPVGLLAGVQLSPEVPAVELFHACIERGVIIRVITGNTVQISPPFVIEAEELSEIVRAITGSLDGLALASAA